MQFRTIEWIAGGLAIVMPAAGTIWLVSSMVNDMRDVQARIDALENTTKGILESQIEDRLVNKRVDKLDEHVDILRFHHHDVRGDDTGGPHTD